MHKESKKRGNNIKRARHGAYKWPSKRTITLEIHWLAHINARDIAMFSVLLLLLLILWLVHFYFCDTSCSQISMRKFFFLVCCAFVWVMLKKRSAEEKNWIDVLLRLLFWVTFGFCAVCVFTGWLAYKSGKWVTVTIRDLLSTPQIATACVAEIKIHIAVEFGIVVMSLIEKKLMSFSWILHGDRCLILNGERVNLICFK